MFECILGASRRKDCCRIYENNEQLFSTTQPLLLRNSNHNQDPKKKKIVEIASLFMNDQALIKLKYLMKWNWYLLASSATQ